MITITLAQAFAWGACQPGINGVIARLGRTPDPDEPIPLPVVLEALNIVDTLWCLAHLDRPLLIRWAVDCAEAAALVAEPRVAALEIENPEETSPRAALEAAAALRAALRAGASLDEIRRLREAASGAYAYASAAVAVATAYAADADDAAAYAAYAAFVSAAVAAEAAFNTRQKMRLWCRERLRAYLEGEDPGPVSIVETS